MHRRTALTLSGVVSLAIASMVVIAAAYRSPDLLESAYSAAAAASPSGLPLLRPPRPATLPAPSAASAEAEPLHPQAPLNPAAVSHPPNGTEPPGETPSGEPPTGELPSGSSGAAGGAEDILIAGDIASCSWRGDSRTARVIQAHPGTVMTSGDNVYQTGTYRQFMDCYEPTWGQFKSRTRPTPGNHDWASGGDGYFRYFGALAGPSGRGYYTFTAGEWRIYALTGDCWRVGGCGPNRAQYQWLEKHLGRDPRRCVMAVWHQPRWSSGPHGGLRAVRHLFSLLYREGAEIVVNGHDHLYERFAPMTPDAIRDEAHGIRQFIVGTGGAPRYGASAPYAPNSVVRNDSTHGVLRLKLEPGGYRWQFLPIDGDTFRDSGSGTCHGAPAG